MMKRIPPKSTNMNASPAAAALLRECEGLRLVAYPDPGTGSDPWTIGYGSTRGVVKGMRITMAEAEARLDEDIRVAEETVRAAVKVPLSQSQFDALVCFAFNVRPGAAGVRDGWVTLKSAQPSTLLRKLNGGDYAAVPDQMQRWNKAGNKVMPGLVLRRRAEAAMWVADDARIAPNSDEVSASPDAPVAKSMAKSRTMQGAAISGTGAVGATITETAQQLTAASESMQWIKALCAVLVVVGVALTIYGRLRIAREEGV